MDMCSQNTMADNELRVIKWPLTGSSHGVQLVYFSKTLSTDPCNLRTSRSGHIHDLLPSVVALSDACQSQTQFSFTVSYNTTGSPLLESMSVPKHRN